MNDWKRDEQKTKEDVFVGNGKTKDRKKEQ